MFGPPVGGVDAGFGEEPEQGIAFFVEVGDKLAALVVWLGPATDQIDPFSQIDDDRSPLVVVEVSGVEGFFEDLAHDPGGGPSPRGQVFDQVVATSENVSQACLVGGLVVAGVGRPAVADDRAGVGFGPPRRFRTGEPMMLGFCFPTLAALLVAYCSRSRSEYDADCRNLQCI